MKTAALPGLTPAAEAPRAEYARLARRVDLGEVARGVAIGLRDRALLSVLAAGASFAEAAALQGDQLRVPAEGLGLTTTGLLLVFPRTNRRFEALQLTPPESAALLAWVADRRLWGLPRPVFGLTRAGVQGVVERYRRMA